MKAEAAGTYKSSYSLQPTMPSSVVSFTKL
jgi:hypothetical protein